MSLRISILYGINEGQGMGKGLIKACIDSGLTVVNEPRIADVIFAHSGGCYLIPTGHQARLVVLAGLPYRPSRLWVTSVAVKVWREGQLYYTEHQLKQWGRKWLYYLRYAIDLRRGFRMALNMHTDRPWNSTKRQVIIRNRNDVFSVPALYTMPFRGPRTFISLPGEHDDCWDHPQLYVGLIQSLLRTTG